MKRLLALARFGLVDVLLHPLRSGATLLCLVALLLPYLAGAGVARGLLAQAESSIRGGADLYVGGLRFGRPAPIPLAALDKVRAVPGVREAVPRIVGEIALGVDRIPTVVVGMPAGRFRKSVEFIHGRLYRDNDSLEIVMGTDLARRLGVAAGSRLPPFYRNDAGERVATVVGVFDGDLPVWETNLLFTSLRSAMEIFDQKGHATGLLVDCEPGYLLAVRNALLREPLAVGGPQGRIAPRVTTREDVRAVLPRSLRHFEGLFHLHFVLAFAVGIPLLMVVSGAGLSERRREAALLKAVGWTTDAVLVKAFVESSALAVLGASIALIGAKVWMIAGNGAGIAGIFLQGAEAAPTASVPFELGLAPALLALAISFSVVATGTLYATWRASTAAPALVLR